MKFFKEKKGASTEGETPDAPEKGTGGGGSLITSAIKAVIAARKRSRENAAEAKKPAHGARRRATSNDVLVMSPGVVTFGGKPAAMGVHWENAGGDTPIGTVIKEMTETAERADKLNVKYDLYLPSQRLGFVGIASSKQGHRKGMGVLISMIDTAMTTDDMVGVFSLSDGEEGPWWVCSIIGRKPISDVVCHDYDEATAMYDLLASDPNIKTRIAPRDFVVNIAPTHHYDLHEVVDMQKGQLLQSVTPIKDKLPHLILGSMGFAALVMGWDYYSRAQEEERQELIRLREEAKANITIGPSDYPWYHAPTFEMFSNQCLAEMDKGYVTIPGWENQPASCSLQFSNKQKPTGLMKIATGWTNAGGNFTALRSALPRNVAAPKVARSGNAEWVQVVSANQSPDWEDVEPWEPAQIEARLIERFQAHGIAHSVLPSPKNKKSSLKTPVFNSHVVLLEVTHGLEDLHNILSGIPAFVPESILYNPEKQAFVVTLRIFHEPLLPVQKK